MYSIYHQNENLLLHSEVKQFRHIAEVTKNNQQMNLEELRKENKTISIENDKLKVTILIYTI